MEQETDKVAAHVCGMLAGCQCVNRPIAAGGGQRSRKPAAGALCAATQACPSAASLCWHMRAAQDAALRSHRSKADDISCQAAGRLRAQQLQQGILSRLA